MDGSSTTSDSLPESEAGCVSASPAKSKANDWPTNTGRSGNAGNAGSS